VTVLCNRDGCTRRSLAESDDTRGCICTICIVDLMMSGLRSKHVEEFNPLNAELNPIGHLLALLEVHHILYVSRIRVNLCNLCEWTRKLCIKLVIIKTLYVFTCLLCFLEQTAIISLYRISWLVFVTETECVYCKVPPVYLKIILVNFRL